MMIGIVLMPTRIRTIFNMEIRIRFGIKTMPIHNTEFNHVDLKKDFPSNETIFKFFEFDEGFVCD
jgi:hypothetical protein